MRSKAAESPRGVSERAPLRSLSDLSRTIAKKIFGVSLALLALKSQLATACLSASNEMKATSCAVGQQALSVSDSECFRAQWDPPRRVAKRSSGVFTIQQAFGLSLSKGLSGGHARQGALLLFRKRGRHENRLRRACCRDDGTRSSIPCLRRRRRRKQLAYSSSDSSSTEHRFHTRHECVDLSSFWKSHGR